MHICTCNYKKLYTYMYVHSYNLQLYRSYIQATSLHIHHHLNTNLRTLYTAIDIYTCSIHTKGCIRVQQTYPGQFKSQVAHCTAIVCRLDFRLQFLAIVSLFKIFPSLLHNVKSFSLKITPLQTEQFLLFQSLRKHNVACQNVSTTLSLNIMRFACK